MLAVKCEFIMDNTLVDTMYVGAEGPIEYTDSKITVGETLANSLSVDGRTCRVNVNAGTVTYKIDAAKKIAD